MKRAAARARYAINKNKYLLEPEYDLLQSTLKKYKDSDFRDTTLLWLLSYTGARASEALNIEDKDLNYHDKTVFVRGLKGSDDRELPLHPWLFDRVAALAQKPGKIFKISYKRLAQIWYQYRPCKKGLHSLRHTYAILLYKKTKDLRLVQVALGHRNITNTMVYAAYVYKKDELRNKALI